MREPGFSRQELRRLRGLRSPVGIQRVLDRMPYHLAKTAWSPRRVLREGTAHCLEQSLSRVDRRALEAGLVGYRAVSGGRAQRAGVSRRGQEASE